MLAGRSSSSASMAGSTMYSKSFGPMSAPKSADVTYQSPSGLQMPIQLVEPRCAGAMASLSLRNTCAYTACT